MSYNPDIVLFKDGKRIDGRDRWQLRPLKIKAHVLNRADGSAYVQWGKNKVIAGVFGPTECLPRHTTNPYKASITCRYMMSPFSSLTEHGRSGPNRRSQELSKVIRKVFENIIITEAYPKTQINIYVEVIQASGGTRVASIVAAAVALADAGILMKDVPFAVSGGKAANELVLDLNKEEDNFGQADMPMAASVKSGEIFLLQMDGMLTKQEVLTLLDKSFESGKQIAELQKNALKEVYTKENKGAYITFKGENNE